MAPRKPGEQARRDARARALGYTSDYDYRTHDYGRVPPDLPRLQGGELRRVRGHASLADLDRALRTGRVELLTVQALRGRRGQFQRVDFLATLDSGETLEFTLTGRNALDPATIERLHDAIEAGGGPEGIQIVGSPPDLVTELGG